MPTPIDPKRLPTLRAAVKKFKPGEKVPQQQLAKIYGVTNARFTTLVHQRFDDFPPPERHGDKTHWYEAIPALNAMIAYMTSNTRRKRAAADRAAEILGDAPTRAEPAGEPAPSAPAESQPLSPAELDRLASAETRTFRLQQEKRQFVRADVARGIIRSLFTTVQRSVSALALEIDPNGELPPMHRARLEAAVRDSMVKIHASVKSLVDEPDAA